MFTHLPRTKRALTSLVVTSSAVGQRLSEAHSHVRGTQPEQATSSLSLNMKWGQRCLTTAMRTKPRPQGTWNSVWPAERPLSDTSCLTDLLPREAPEEGRRPSGFPFLAPATINLGGRRGHTVRKLSQKVFQCLCRLPQATGPLVSRSRPSGTGEGAETQRERDTPHSDIRGLQSKLDQLSNTQEELG